MTYSDEIVALGPIGYWRLGDTSGTTAVATVGSNGTYEGSPTQNVTGLLTGDADKAVTFDGSNDSVNIGDQTWFDGTNKWSITGWWNVTPDATYRRFVAKEDDNNWGVYIFSQNTEWGVVRTSSGGAMELKPANSAPSGLHFICATYATDDKLHLYVDGAQVTESAATTVSINNHAHPLRISGAETGLFNVFNGTIDEVAVFDRALSAVEIAHLYDIGTGGTPAILARDDFSDTIASSLGTADIGGSWTESGTASEYDKAGGVGVIEVAASGIHFASLTDLALQDSDIRVKTKITTLPTGGAVFSFLTSRTQAATDLYWTQLEWRTTGGIRGGIARRIGNTGSGGTLVALDDVAFGSLTYTAGEWFWMRMQTEGVSPTTIRFKIWEDGTSEPGSWQQTTTDATSPLQSTGAIGLGNNAGSGLSNGPAFTSFEDYLATEIAVTEEGVAVLLLGGL